jgi:tetratricopeptide (TPR) repeat protein
MKCNPVRFLTFVLFLSFFIPRYVESQVTVTTQNLTIPTYQVMEPDPNPVFFNGRRYQGAKGMVYPYPLTHNLTDSIIDKDYEAVIIENEFIEVCILPELGGRIHYAKDKTNDYYFLYHNQVIKPALIGMTGAWVSGGVEWNIPHHHRASSFYPVEHSITENGDGSKTVWVGETELRHRSKWIVGITLHPGKSLIETTIRVFNTTPFQNSILVWANAAVHANENYQIFFPPKTRHATYHRKNQFTDWPFSTQQYDGADYSEGVDVSRWDNHSKSTSFFEWGNNGNFVAGIDHGKEAGTVIFGDKYINPGKKLWSWGNNPSGAMWDALLTDEDGPYVELMFGSFSDNQPDYSWIQTRETKESRYWFSPLKGLASIQKANNNAFIGFEILNDTLRAGINVVEAVTGAEISIYEGDRQLFNQTADLSPHQSFLWQTENLGFNVNELRILLKNPAGKVLIEYQIEPIEDELLPDPVSSPLEAGALNDPDSLYFEGLKHEQFHDPFYMPLDYYSRALELNPAHIPSLVRTGMLKLKAGNPDSAAIYLDKVYKRVTADYAVAENATSLYYLALAFKETGREREAYELFYRASWDYSFHSAARYQLALLDSRRGDYGSAIEHLRHAYSTNIRSIDIISLMVSMYRLNGEPKKALQWAETLLEMDPLNLWAVNEKFLVNNDRRTRQQLEGMMRNYHENYLELAAGYGNAGLVTEAKNVLERYNQLPVKSRANYPMVHYYLGYFNHLEGKTDIARKNFITASGAPVEYAFPFRFESVRVLETALEYNEEDAMAWYLKGNIYYDHQPERAVEAWTRSATLNDKQGVVYRNLAFASANIKNDPESAISYIERAIGNNPDDPRYYYEYDLYQKALLASPESRLEPFAKNHDVVVSDQITIFPYVELLTLTGNFDQAINLMKSRHFHRWEGGESIYLYWIYAHLFKVKAAINSNLATEAELLLQASLSFPVNLQSVTSSHETIAYYYRGLVAEMMKQPGLAESYFMSAVNCRSSAPECDYYAARAYEKLSRSIASQSIFEYMVEGGLEELLANEDDMDFFDPFARTRSRHEIQANAYFKVALGYHGLGDLRNAEKYYGLAKEHNPAIMSLVFDQ